MLPNVSRARKPLFVNPLQAVCVIMSLFFAILATLVIGMV